MVKGNSKSSASSATRKKHARKAIGPEDVAPIPKEKKPKTKEKGKGKNAKEPRVKMYIPPTKPVPVQPDPLDTTGLAHRLPPELLIVLRSLGKKAEVTKLRALEDLQSNWVDRCGHNGDETIVYTLVDMLPVWLHHVPSLFTHPSRRLRLLSSSIHATFLHIKAVREQFLFFLAETAPPHQLESVYGTWCMIAHDVDRLVANNAVKSWNEFIATSKVDTLNSTLEFCQRALLDPLGTYTHLNPPQPVVPVQPSHARVKGGSRRGSGRQTPVSQREDSGVSRRDEEFEETESDREGRLRVGAFGAIRWVLEHNPGAVGGAIVPLLSNPALWTSLSHTNKCSSCPGVEGFGCVQPPVRKSAWAMVQTLLHLRSEKRKDYIQSDGVLPILSTAILRSAFIETDATVQNVMWQPLLTFLREFPSAWVLESKYREARDDEGDEDSDESGDDEPSTKQPSVLSRSTENLSIAYRDFLQFLQLGCSGSPIQGYPAVVVVLSTIPLPIMAASSSTPLAELYTSFWAAVDGRALNSLQRASASAAFVSSLLECLVFLVKRVHGKPLETGLLLGTGLGEDREGYGAAEGKLKELVGEQFVRVLADVVGKSLKVEASAVGKSIAQHLSGLQRVAEDCSQSTWTALASSFTSLFEASTTKESLRSLLIILKTIDERLSDSDFDKSSVDLLVGEILLRCVSHCEEGVKESEEPKPELFLAMLVAIDVFGTRLWQYGGLVERMKSLIFNNVDVLILRSPELLSAYLGNISDEACNALWTAILSAISGRGEEQDRLSVKALQPWLDVAKRGGLPICLRDKAASLDAVLAEMLGEALQGRSTPSSDTVVLGLFSTPEFFTTQESLKKNVATISAYVLSEVDVVLRDREAILPSLGFPLQILDVVMKSPFASVLTVESIAVTLCPALVLFVHLLPICYTQPIDEDCLGIATDLLKAYVDNGAESLEIIRLRVVDSLSTLFRDSQARPTSGHILSLIDKGVAGFSIDFMKDIMPSRAELDEQLELLSPDPAHPSLAILDPMIPAGLDSNSEDLSLSDDTGRTYTRVIMALLRHLRDNPSTLSDHLWALRHFLALSLYASDLRDVPFAKSPVFSSADIMAGDIAEVIDDTQTIVRSVLSAALPEGWRRSVIAAAQSSQPTMLAGSPGFVVESIVSSLKEENLREARILYRTLATILGSDVSSEEVDLWLGLVRKLEKLAPMTSTAIIRAIADCGTDSQRLDRYRNELAATLTGIPPSKADTQGFSLLRKLVAVSPNPESDVIFLPQQRAVSLVKTCQQWVTSDDEDVGEDVESEMTEIFIHVAPILQTVPGAHWDFMMDVVESNIEVCSLADTSTYVTLQRTLRLVHAIEDLTSTNKSLRAVWQERRLNVFRLLCNMATPHLSPESASVPRSVCLKSLLTLLQELPESLIDQTTLDQLCHLLNDGSYEVQKLAYGLLQKASRKRTEFLVIEAGVNVDADLKTELPLELLELLRWEISDYDQDHLPSRIFAHLLGWMVLFDLFIDASLKVRSVYVEQLRDLGIVSSYLIPNVFNLLRLPDGINRAFKLDAWAVDEFYVQYYEPEESFSVSVLSAHLYYRSLLTIPSLVYSWVLDCKDRQLSSTIASYTSSYFSPVLIRAELAHVRDPEATSDLIDDSFKIKVASNANEITASYTVDEQQLEIKLKIPTDWPLHRIEVQDNKTVGVDDRRWRAWILGVQQTVWSLNGHVLDGLGVFKKNVTLHFEGQVECAICYSIISVSDGNLPKKPCNTCKNRFHAGCLYKWFSTSHSSSCPLCRSDII